MMMSIFPRLSSYWRVISYVGRAISGFAFMLAMLVAACAPALETAPPDVLTDVTPVFLDAEFSSADRRVIETAIDRWNFALHGYEIFVVEGVEWHPSADRELPSGAVTVNASKWIPDYLSRNTLGWTEGRAVFLLPLPQREALQVTEHELGHVLGLEHVPGTLMDPFIDDSTDCIDRRTLVQLAALHDWSASELRSTCP